MQKNVYIKTFGCQMNERDSEILAQTLAGCGYVESMEIEDADLVILNTCSIRAKAEQKVMSLLGYLRKQKQKNNGLRICVAGCVAQQEGEQLLNRMPHVDLVVGTQQIYRIGELIAEVEAKGSLVATGMTDTYDIPQLLPSPGVASEKPVLKGDGKAGFSRFVTIMQGCNNYCTYCVVPYTRGRENSRKVIDIVGEVKKLVEAGVREITLLGQNVNSYGKTNPVTQDGSPMSFASLLRQIAAIPGVDRLRFTTSNPKDLDDSLMRCFAELENLCPQFHLPVQAGSNEVLQRMNRKYTVEQYLSLVARLKGYRPDLALTTDIIVGFPGERDDDFQKTMDLLNEVRYHGSFSFKYSDRPGTRASSFADKIAEEVKSERLSRFQARQDQISLERNNEYIGTLCNVLVEDFAEDMLKTRAATNHLVHIPYNAEHQVSPGSLIKARITGAGQHSLRGELIR